MLDAFLDRHACGERVRFVSALLLEEAVSNLFLRATRPAERCQVVLTWDEEAGELSLSLEDDGEPFDPCHAPAYTAASDLSNAPDGGRGIHLMRVMADEMRYVRDSGRNRLSFRVRDRGRGEEAGQGARTPSVRSAG